MNDEDIRRHLERRADAGGPPPEFLPSVREAIVSEPQRSVVSRMSVLAGIAVTTAVFVLLVTALPRLSIGPAATGTATAGATPALAETPRSAQQSPTSSGTVPTPKPSSPPFESVIGCSNLRPVVVRDETGLVGQCQASQTVGLPEDPIVVDNLSPAQLRVAWSGPTCEHELFLRPTEAGFDLEIRQTAKACPLPIIRQTVGLDLSLPVVGALVQPRLTTEPSDPLPMRRSLQCSNAVMGTQVSGIRTAVFDETNLVESCLAWETTFQGRLPAVSNPLPDHATVKLYRQGTSCDERATLTFAGSHSVYEITAETVTTDCSDERAVGHMVALSVAEPVAAETVSASATGSVSVAHTLECQAVGEDADVEVHDIALVVESCQVNEDEQDPPGFVVISDDDTADLRVTVAWEASNGCPDPATLRIWDRSLYRDVRDDRPRYLVQIDRSPRGSIFLPRGCFGPRVSKSVTLTFGVDVAASDVEAFVTLPNGLGLDVHSIGHGQNEFQLAVDAGKAVYTQGEPIAVSSSLSSDMDATLSCTDRPVIALEQLDGPIQFTPGPFIAMCPPPIDLQAGTPLTTTLLPAVWGYRDPHPLEPYIRDGELFLPAGTYRLYAGSSFALGDDLSRDRIDLKASSVIEVR